MKRERLDCPYDFTSRCTMGRCDCKPKEEPKQETLVNDFMVWDELFGILAWKFKPTKSGDMFLDAEKVFEELKDKFELKKK